MENDPKLTVAVVNLLVDPGNDLLLSPATFRELAIKVSLGKYRLSDPLVDYIKEAIRLYELTILPITVAHAEAVVNLPHHRKAPFDRMRIAQSIVEDVALVSSDEAFASYSVTRLLVYQI